MQETALCFSRAFSQVSQVTVFLEVVRFAQRNVGVAKHYAQANPSSHRGLSGRFCC